MSIKGNHLIASFVQSVELDDIIVAPKPDWLHGLRAYSVHEKKWVWFAGVVGPSRKVALTAMIGHPYFKSFPVECDLICCYDEFLEAYGINGTVEAEKDKEEIQIQGGRYSVGYMPNPDVPF